MRQWLLIACIPALFLQSANAADYPRVRIETTAGNFTVELNDERAPLTVANFLRYVKDGYYKGTIFHRIVNGFVVQGGGYTVDLKPKKARDPIPNESGNGLSNRRMTIAMARTSKPHTADSQFYINLADNLDLDPKPTRWGYAVFGEVVEGSEVIDDIGYRPTSPQGSFEALPAAPVIIEKVVLLPASESN
ncbi:MAG TPA: peptidyl-prolyl cis-trans isomerase [Chromatiales bacterium]|nr:peptidyl-prolyl cis-trans isomerase [Chromatiales bacterium]